MTPEVPAAVVPAATVLLLRTAPAGAGLEVLMMRRAAALTFMGGLWVFPGGRLDDADLLATSRVLVESPGDAAAGIERVRQRMLDAHSAVPVPPGLALGLHVTACRETFEEAGILLARDPSRSSSLPAAQLTRLAGHRSASESDASAFVRLLETESLYLEVDRLVYWSHWITPSAENRRRFDTRFFAVEVPAGQLASVNEGELTQIAWLGEEAIRQRLASGEFQMAPPTLATLEDLWRSFARHRSIAAMLDAERSRVVPPILPKLVRTGAAVEVVLPWDESYATMPGEGSPARDRYPDYLVAMPSRHRLTKA